MTPFFFGSGERRLFGIYEPAAFGPGGGTRAAVLCNPWGAEYLYAHRTLRDLSIKLSAAGFHSLRFDFFGTGDSAGEMADADPAGWEADVELALDEIRDMVGAARIVLIGMRLGATIAARVAARLPGAVDALVLWDPVVSGAEYLAALGAESEIDGFPLTEPMRVAFQAIDLAPSLSAPSTRTLLLLTDPLPSADALRPVAAADAAGSLDIDIVAAVRPWAEDPATVGIVPFAVVQRIVAWLG